MSTKSRTEMRKRRHVRVRKKLAGTAARPRLNVFRSLNEVYAQVIDDGAGKTLVAASSLDDDLRAGLKGKNKTDQARLVGQAAQGVRQVVFDRGGFRYHGRVRALAEAAREAGLEF
jgi:large subunit ribosomal protein L18